MAPLRLNKIHWKQNPTQFICKNFVICIEQVLINWQLWKSHHDIINQIIMVSTVETYYLFSLFSNGPLSYRALNIDNVFAEPRLHNSSSPGEPECKKSWWGQAYVGPPPDWKRVKGIYQKLGGGGVESPRAYTFRRPWTQLSWDCLSRNLN